MKSAYITVALLVLTIPALSLTAILIISNSPIDQDAPQTQFITGNAHFLQGDYAAAAKDYEQILAIKPNDEKALNNLAVSYNKIGNYAGAANALSKLIAINPQSASYHYDYAVNVVLTLKEDNDGTIEEVNDALAHFKTAAELSPSYSKVKENIAFLEDIKAQYDAKHN